MTIEHPWIDITVAIRHVPTGEVRIHHDTGRKMSDGSLWDFQWRDGNYACDCNRALFFARAAGEPDIEQGCADVLYSIDWIKDADGNVLYSETFPDSVVA